MHNVQMDSDWFKARKKALRVNDEALGQALGVDRSVANKVINGSVEFNAKRAEAVAQLLEEPVDEILVRAGILSRHFARYDTLPSGRIPKAPDNDDDVVDIISLDLSLSMGPGTLIEEFVEAEPVKMGLSLIQAITRTPTDRLRLVRGIGHSMEPTLRTDDRILIDINDRGLASLGGVYWIDYEGAHGIKRLRPAGRGRVLIMSDNSAVEPPFEVSASDLRIEGRAIWFGRDL